MAWFGLAMALILVAGVSPGAQISALEQQSSPGASAEEHVRKLIASLPRNSGWRNLLEHGARGDGVHQPWMDHMRKDGVKLAKFTIEFLWTQRGRKLEHWIIVGEQYFRDYDESQPVAAQEELDLIRQDGLQWELEAVALSLGKDANWFEYPSEEGGEGYRLVYLADDEWLPVGISRFFGKYEPGTTPLMHAAMLGDVTRIKKLLKQRADVNAVAPDGSTALMWAASTGSPAAVEVLLSGGASVSANPDGRGDALLAAVVNNRPENVRVLLNAGADPNSKTVDGESVLAFATRQHYTDIVRLLKQAGARQ